MHPKEAMEALNKTLALVLWGKDHDGEDDVAVFSGTLIQENESYFLQREDSTNPEIRQEWLSRIQVVPEELKEILMDCEYQLSLSVGDVDSPSEHFEAFGLKWPSA